MIYMHTINVPTDLGKKWGRVEKVEVATNAVPTPSISLNMTHVTMKAQSTGIMVVALK